MKLLDIQDVVQIQDTLRHIRHSNYYNESKNKCKHRYQKVV